MASLRSQSNALGIQPSFFILDGCKSPPCKSCGSSSLINFVATPCIMCSLECSQSPVDPCRHLFVCVVLSNSSCFFFPKLGFLFSEIVTSWWIVKFLGSCLLEGKNLVERLERELKQQRFYLAKGKYTPEMLQNRLLYGRWGGLWVETGWSLAVSYLPSSFLPSCSCLSISLL